MLKDLADDAMDEATRADMAQWTGCIAGRVGIDEAIADAKRVTRLAGVRIVEPQLTADAVQGGLASWNDDTTTLDVPHPPS